jgi:hypothetical protein
MEVQDGASETMRNAVERFEMWPGAIIQENSKDVTAKAGAEEKRSRRLLDVTMKNLNQVFGGTSFARVYFGGFAEDVITDFAVNDFDQQAVDGAPAGRDLLQHCGAFAFLFERGTDAFDLALDTIDASEKFATFLNGVSHKNLQLTYYTGYSIGGKRHLAFMLT